MLALGRMLNWWLTYRLWRLRRWNARQNCEAHHRHEVVENEIQSGNTHVKVAWCRGCTHVTWID